MDFLGNFFCFVTLSYCPLKMLFKGKINMFKKIFTNNSYSVSNTFSSLKPVNKKYTDTALFESSLRKKPDYILIKTLGTGNLL
jgi:hypothetical protein